MCKVLHDNLIGLGIKHMIISLPETIWNAILLENN